VMCHLLPCRLFQAGTGAPDVGIHGNQGFDACEL
jgi:hypothetical protein